MDDAPIRGTVKNGMIEPTDPLTLPEGTEVIITLVGDEDANGTIPATRRLTDEEILKIAGMWADREDMTDANEFVRRLRGSRE
jgi:hypothetical protein